MCYVVNQLFYVLLTHPCLQGPLEIVVLNYDTFDDNFEIKNNFAKILKRGCL